MLLSNGNSLWSAEMNESILNHLFLPHYLPDSSETDYLIKSNHQNEYKLLECMKEYFDSFESTNAAVTLPIIPILIDCIQRWSVLQNALTNSIFYLQAVIEQLPSEGFLPLYFHAQNAAILIEIDINNNN
jgi:hypothetical protein